MQSKGKDPFICKKCGYVFFIPLYQVCNNQKHPICPLCRSPIKQEKQDKTLYWSFIKRRGGI